MGKLVCHVRAIELGINNLTFLKIAIDRTKITAMFASSERSKQMIIQIKSARRVWNKIVAVPADNSRPYILNHRWKGIGDCVSLGNTLEKIRAKGEINTQYWTQAKSSKEY